MYVVETDPENPRHHEGVANKSTYLITTQPKPGDRIIYVLEDDAPWGDEKAGLQLFSYTKKSRVDRVKCNLRRSAQSGESGEYLSKLWLEKLNGSADWEYAPCEVELIPEPNYTQKKEWEQWKFNSRLEATHKQGRWILEDLPS